MRIRLACACIALVVTDALAAPTAKCSQMAWNLVIWLQGVSPDVAARVQSAVARPGSDPGMTAVIGDATSAEYNANSFGGPALRLSYTPADDVGEIGARMRLNAVLGYAGVDASNGLACFAVPYPITKIEVTEYHNSILDHYFLSSSAEENRMLDSGGAGPGWTRTGERFTAYRPDYCATNVMASKWVQRFYGSPGIGPNSHFFTAGPDECGMLRNTTGWTYEGPAFGAELPVNGACPAPAPRPVYRAYNMRWAQNDSNHRLTTSFATYQSMLSRGWYGEGIAFCLPNEP